MRAYRRPWDRAQRARNGMTWSAYLGQGEQWMTAGGTMVPVADMDPGWRHNAARWLRRHAHWLPTCCGLSKLPVKDRSRWLRGTALYRALVGLPDRRIRSTAGVMRMDRSGLVAPAGSDAPWLDCFDPQRPPLVSAGLAAHLRREAVEILWQRDASPCATERAGLADEAGRLLDRADGTP